MTVPLRHEVQIAAPRHVVFDMFVDPALLVRWIGIDAWLQPRPDHTRPGARAPTPPEDPVIEVTSSTVVARPAAEAFAYVANAENNPAWQRGMRSCRWTTEPPIAVGSVYEQEASFLGRPITSTFEVVDLQPDRSITITTTMSTFPITVTRSVEPLGDEHSRVSAVVQGDPSGVFRIATPLMRAMVRRSVRGDYRRLGDVLGRPG